jgi:polyisoprenoid-binding protein YceI
MATATLTRPASTGRRVAPPEGTWVVDPDRAVVAFSGRASFLAPTISARFADVAGAVQVGDEHWVRVEIDVTSMTTGNRAYDDLIASFDPFESARFPIAVYRSTAVAWTPDGARIDGTLTLRGMTREVSLTAAYDVGRWPDRMIVRAGGSVDREAFGVRFDVPGLGKLVPRVLRLDIDVDVTLTA